MYCDAWYTWYTYKYTINLSVTVQQKIVPKNATLRQYQSESFDIKFRLFGTCCKT